MTEQRNDERMEKTEERLGESGTEPESVLIFLSPPQSGVTFRAIEEGHGWSLLCLLFLHHLSPLYGGQNGCSLCLLLLFSSSLYLGFM